MTKRFFSLAFAALCAIAAMAQIPSGYYNTLTGKKDAELKTAIYNLVRNFTLVSSYNALPQYFQRTDVYPDSKRWWDMYSDIPLYAPSFSGLNREHSFPKSWWGGSQTVTAYVDLNHLYPSEMKANTAKSNYPLGTVDVSQTPKFNNGVCKVGYAVAGQGGGAKFVFEPADEYKGDFARTYFYMATCYQNLTWRYTYMVAQNTYPTLNAWAVNLLLKWHRQDPVSEKETLRNEAVYKIQNNRNPFIDYPELAEYIWGNHKGEAFRPGTATTPSGDPNLITPVQDMSLDFNQVALGQSVTSRLLFKGENLTNNLAVRIYRDDSNKGYFTLPGKAASVQIEPRYVNTENGYELVVTYTPQAVGEHTARLLITGGATGMASRGIELRGECLPVPTLGACTATAPTDVTAESYTANWMVPAGDVVDYWEVTRTRYKDGKATSEVLLAEGTSLEITEFDQSDYETYSVQSVRLGYRSPMSNTVTVNHAGINDVTVAPLAVEGYEGGLRFICGSTHTNARICDTMGRIVSIVETVTNNTCVDLPAGIYLVTTDNYTRAIKVIVR